MGESHLDVVTGGLGYSSRRIAERLLERAPPARALGRGQTGRRHHVFTREEIAGRMQNLLVTDSPTVERIRGKRAQFGAERSLKEERKLPCPIPRLNFT